MTYSLPPLETRITRAKQRIIGIKEHLKFLNENPGYSDAEHKALVELQLDAEESNLSVLESRIK